jgi:hypothetical protein
MAKDQKKTGGITSETKDTGTKTVANKLALMAFGERCRAATADTWPKVRAIAVQLDWFRPKQVSA